MSSAREVSPLLISNAQNGLTEYLSNLLSTYQQELNYIRAENHEAQQRLDREQIEQEDAAENERQYREAMRQLRPQEQAPDQPGEFDRYQVPPCQRQAVRP